MSQAHSGDMHYFSPDYTDNYLTLMTRDSHCLHAYWQISNESKQAFYKDFGQDIWNKSIPVLKVTNVTNNESFFIRINEFSNSWYINIPESNSTYFVELGRKVSERFFISLASSNIAFVPGEGVIPSDSIYFANYKDLRIGNLNYEEVKTYESRSLKLRTDNIFGLSSTELLMKG